MRLFFLLGAAALLAQAVDQSKFRVCSQTNFCERNRNNFVPQDYEIRSASVSYDKASSTITAELQNTVHPKQETLSTTIKLLQNDVVRVSIREKNPKFERWEVPDVLEHDGLKQIAGEFTSSPEGSKLTFGTDGSHVLELTNKPFAARLLLNGEPAISINTEGKMNFELLRDKKPKPEGEEPKLLADMASGYDVEGMWEEKFSSHTDTKPRGPESIGMDVTFGSSHIYGIPEHATSFALKNTNGEGPGAYTDPYRLYNLDVFEYDLDVPMALYGAVPFMLSHDEKKTSAMLWLNAAETFIDVKDGMEADTKTTHWISESGIIDMFLMTSTKPSEISLAYATLTGFSAMPQRFAIGYHQCRWNYKSEEDVAQVDAGFDEHDIPYDTLWLDIEHTDGKKYFTWDRSNFPTPEDMQNKIASKGRKMVTIVDPHIKRDANYHVHSQALAKDLYVKNKDSGVYEGWCWPGSASYLDFMRPEVRDYWADLFSLEQYKGSTPHLYTWNDMNEPSVFNGPEVTMPKDNLHLGGKAEHRDVHNMYGFYHHMATTDGLVKRDNARPFVLTRSFFSGSQKYSAVWTGDNMAKWSHLEAASPMLLALNVAGITFSGADVGGFFGDPEPELLLRWYQVAAFQPFFRGHAHIDAKRREPWLFGEPWTSHIRKAIRRRYAYLPFIYSVFQESSATGLPVMRPLWMEFPQDKTTFDIEQEFMVGDSLLIKAVAKANQLTTSVYLPGTGVWYDVANGNQLKGGVHTSLDTPLDTLPILQRGGTIVTKRERARRCSNAMQKDPFTLVIALDKSGQAAGKLYLDDGSSFDYQQGAYVHRQLTFADKTLSSSTIHAGAFTTDTTVERVVIFGVAGDYKSALVTSAAGQVEVPVLRTGNTLVIRKPDAKISEDWTITLQ